ncbi:MAG: aldo/keto reductase [Bryobacterales bacterium]|nr:aldo/keto reductase [Bryobacterales bacterium]
MRGRCNSRRDFLRLSTQTAIAAAIATKADATPADTKGEWRNKQSGMAYRKLGRTAFMISEMVMGGNLISPTNHDQVFYALDQGLNYLDTAPAYGNGQSELGYAQVLKARKRDSFFLNTKISLFDINRNKLYQEIFQSLAESEQKKLLALAQDDIERRKALDPDYFCNYFNSQRGEVEQSALANVMEKKYGRTIDRNKNYKQLVFDSFEESLKRLGTDHVDLLMCPHGASSGYELRNYPEVIEAFEVLKKAGKVRHLGVSSHSDPGGVLDAAAEMKVYSAAMVAYNVVNHAYVDKALAKAHQNGVGVIAMKVARPVHHGRNNGQPDDPGRVAKIQSVVEGPLKVPQKAYVWGLRSPYLSAVISEMGSMAITKDNLPLAAPKA